MKVKLALIGGEADVFSTPKDVSLLAHHLGQDVVFWYEIVDDPDWTHMDFVWNKDVKHILYDRVVDKIIEFDEDRPYQP